MPPHNRKLKIITLDIGGENFEIQVKTWKLNNETEDGEPAYTFAPDGEYIEETDPVFNLELVLLADWKLNGVSDFLWSHNGETVPFQIDHHPDITAEHVRWNGNLKIKAPTVGGEARTTELTEITLAVVGEPVYSRP